MGKMWGEMVCFTSTAGIKKGEKIDAFSGLFNVQHETKLVYVREGGFDNDFFPEVLVLRRQDPPFFPDNAPIRRNTATPVDFDCIPRTVSFLLSVHPFIAQYTPHTLRFKKYLLRSARPPALTEYGVRRGGRLIEGLTALTNYAGKREHESIPQRVYPLLGNRWLLKRGEKIIKKTECFSELGLELAFYNGVNVKGGIYIFF